MWDISFGFDLGRSFHLIPLKLDRIIDTMENWSCQVYGPNRPTKRGKGLGVMQIQEFIENESLSTEFPETQQVNNDMV